MADFSTLSAADVQAIANKDVASISPEGIAFLEKNYPLDPQTIQDSNAFKDNMGMGGMGIGGIGIWQLIIVLALLATAFVFIFKFNKSRANKKENFSKERMNSNNGKTKMTLLYSLKSYFINWNDFRSRASRSEYWWAALVITLGSYVVGFGIGFIIAITLSGVGFSQDAIDGVVGIVVLVWIIFSVIAGTSLVVRRLHDVDRSGWWFLIYWFCKKGTTGINRYGEDPLDSSIENYERNDVNSSQTVVANEKVSSSGVISENIDLINKLYEMKEKGIITDEEFQKKKSTLL
jgi:uncharacterized membrane protein YhaH (DUF805 family)